MLSYKTHLLCFIAHDMLFYITHDYVILHTLYVMLCYIPHDMYVI